jgi:phage gpG-like protein
MSTFGLNVTGRVLGAADVQAKFARAGLTAHDAVRDAVSRLGNELLAHVVRDKLQGQVLHVRTDNLQRAINMRLDDQESSVYAYVGVNRTAPYGRIQELGGTTSPHDIVAKRAQALAFVMGGKTVVVKRVHHPGSHIPERSFLRSALDDMRPEVAQRIQAALVRAIREA